jgi:probable HAF family extracellular repeat protein
LYHPRSKKLLQAGYQFGLPAALSVVRRKFMKSKMLIFVPAVSIFAALAAAQSTPAYQVVDLGPVGTPFGEVTSINNAGLAAGVATAPNGTQYAVLSIGGSMQSIQTGMGGPNSAAGAINGYGMVLGQAETQSLDPNNENFCGFGTSQQCLAFLWNYGVTTRLPTLGGTNASFGWINNVGQAVGIAETAQRDPECPGGKAINGTGPYVLDFEAVIWGPRPGQIQQLPPLPGDSVGMAFGINDLGQVVGASGRCGNTVLPGFAAAAHAVLWDSDGSVHDLGNLGGTSNPAMLAVGNAALSINNQGQVTGVSALPGSQTMHPFLWTSAKGMQDLGVVPGDLVGAGLGINNLGQVVGASISAPGPASGNPRAFLWQNGVMSDLNTLVQANSPLYLLNACAINDVGQITGFGATSTGEVHAFLAIPGH